MLPLNKNTRSEGYDVDPPSAGMTAPMIRQASAEATKAMTLATSFGSATPKAVDEAIIRSTVAPSGKPQLE